ncbi:response regulator [Larkinella rosea]|uniref:DNA-binding response regulator n=1 Tax=Larkinella rosea TaxID=2025312 RepID=A0A3P1BPU8_9BACT|nr:response regulator transcription factor [Larkinella rosea]RRB02594.1 DNA-binding response regulator [Larkinella rosea]
MALRLLIADDHPLLVDGLISVLEEIEDVLVLEPVSNGRQLIDRLRKLVVDVILLDLNMPHLDGIASLKIIKTEFFHVKVIVFTSYDQPKLIREIKTLGAEGYLLKTSNSTTLKKAIATVAAGKTWFPETAVESPEPEIPADDFIKKYQITKREVEIIRMIAEGLTTKQIGDRLFVSEFTINSHRRNICRKLNIYTPVGLLNFAKEQGLV